MAFVEAVRSDDHRDDPDRIGEGALRQAATVEERLAIGVDPLHPGVRLDHAEVVGELVPTSEAGSVVSEVRPGDVPTEELVPLLIGRSGAPGLERGVVVGVFNHPSNLPHWEWSDWSSAKRATGREGRQRRSLCRCKSVNTSRSGWVSRTGVRTSGVTASSVT